MRPSEIRWHPLASCGPAHKPEHESARLGVAMCYTWTVNLAWATDIHLDHIEGHKPCTESEFFAAIRASRPAVVLLTGDIATASSLSGYLRALEDAVQVPVLFVLGNHDFWGSSVEAVREEMRQLTSRHRNLKWMGAVPYHPLTETTAVVGHDGWYDGLNGVLSRNFIMNDWFQIGDYRKPMKQGLLAVRDLSTKLAHESVEHVRFGIEQAVKRFKHIIVLTHVPPWPETNIYEGKVGSLQSQPWFTSKLMGDMLHLAASAYPNVNFTVLCGHTHGKFDGMILPNLRCKVGSAEYGEPVVQEVIEVE